MSNGFAALVAGHICLDVLPDLSGTDGERFMAGLQPGRLLEVGPARFSTGGPVSNTGLALHRLGIPTRLVAKIGDDLFGYAVRSIIAGYDTSAAPLVPGAKPPSDHRGLGDLEGLARGTGKWQQPGALAAGLVVDPAASTSYSVVISPPGRDRLFLHSPGANNAFVAADVPDALLAGARLFHFGYPPIMRRMYEHGGAELVTLFARARSSGATTSLDMCLPDPASPAGQVDWPALLAAVLPYVDVFMPSIEEILYMLRPAACEALADTAPGDSRGLSPVTPDVIGHVAAQLLDLGAVIVGLKLGSRGLYLRTAGRAAFARLGRAAPADPAAWASRELWAPCFEVQVAGTTGAGDATIAGFLAALLRGLDAESAVTAAVAVGACNVEAPDALSGIRSWDDTMARIAAGWPQHDLDLAPDSGWHWHHASRLWYKSLQ